MKEFEIRETKGYCRLCEHSSNEKMVVIPFHYSGKSAPIMLCAACIKVLHEAIQ